MKLFRSVCCLVLAAALTGCGPAPDPGPMLRPDDPLPPAPATETTAEAPSTEAPTEAPTKAPTETITEAPTEAVPVMAESLARKMLAEMTLREKIGQLFIVRPDALDESILPEDMDNSRGQGVTALTDAMVEGLQKYPVGGVIFFDKNIESPDQVKAFTADLQKAGTVPMFLSIDEEGGIVSRLANHLDFDLPIYDSAWDVFHHKGVDGARDMGMAIGTYLQDYGFNMDFAPVADVWTNPKNHVIGSRAFSSDPWEAADAARAMADGLMQHWVIPVYKHFPGHGNTKEDSHEGLAISRRTPEELEACEWIPFRQATRREAIMVGHVSLPKVTDSDVPATLSHTVVTGILKDQLGFEGLVVTDSMSMGAILRNYSTEDATLKALRAGCHVILMPYHLPQAFDAVAEAVESGEFPMEQLDEIVLKILEFKEYHHILK